MKAKSKKPSPTRKPDKAKKTEDKSARTDEKERKKVKQKKAKNAWELLDDPELADVERQYFDAVQQVLRKIPHCFNSRAFVVKTIKVIINIDGRVNAMPTFCRRFILPSQNRVPPWFKLVLKPHHYPLLPRGGKAGC